jgi:hypothetical protein
VAYADDVNIAGENMDSIQKNTKALLHARTEVCLDVNPEKAKFMLMSRCKIAGQKHSIRIANSSLKMWQSSNIWEQH